MVPVPQREPIVRRGRGIEQAHPSYRVPALPLQLEHMLRIDRTDADVTAGLLNEETAGERVRHALADAESKTVGGDREVLRGGNVAGLEIDL